MSATKTVTTLYNPGSKDKDALIKEFVIRLKEFDNIFKDIKTSKMKTPEQHYLLVGQRGSGKSTLIQRLRYSIEDDEQLNKWLIPLAFTEEQYNITELGNLWERISEFLEDYHNIPGIVAELEAHAGNEAKQLDVLLATMRKHKKKLVLFIDNIGDMLKKFEDVEVKRLREVLQTIPDIRLIAASPLMLGSILDHQSALFEFFKTVRLGGLNKEEIERLLLKLGEQHNSKDAIEKIIKDSPERIEILRRLTGGVVRTVVMMFNVFVENADGNPIGDLNSILDDATPLYKHKMDDLPKQQQKIVDAVMRNWEAITSGEIAEKLRMDSKQISAQLRQLEKDQWIEKIETTTKNYLYQAKERFFNIWYLMRYGRRFDKTRVIWLVKFMESWLEKAELENRMKKLIDKIYRGEVDKSIVAFWTEVYGECTVVSPLIKFNLLYLTQNLLANDSIDTKAFKQKGDEIEREVYEHPERLSDSEIQIMLGYGSTNDNIEQYQIGVLKAFEAIFAGNYAISDIARNKWIEVLEKQSEIEEIGFADHILSMAYSKNNNDRLNLYVGRAAEKGSLFLQCEFADTLSVFSKDEWILIIESIHSQYHSFLNYKILNSISLLLKGNVQESLDLFESTIATSISKGQLTILLASPVESLIVLYFSKGQYKYLEKVFDGLLKDSSSTNPFRYVLMHYMKDEYPNEYLRMPPEMKDTVEDIIKKVEEYRVKYA